MRAYELSVKNLCEEDTGAIEDLTQLIKKCEILADQLDNSSESLSQLYAHYSHCPTIILSPPLLSGLMRHISGLKIKYMLSRFLLHVFALVAVQILFDMHTILAL